MNKESVGPPYNAVLPPPLLSVSLPVPVVPQPSSSILLQVPVACITPHGLDKPLETAAVAAATSNLLRDGSVQTNTTLFSYDSQQVEIVDNGGAMKSVFVPAVYPPCSISQKKGSNATLGEVVLPVAFAAPVRVVIERNASVLPRQLPPPYVVFGGARYDNASMVRKATQPPVKAKGSCRSAAVKRDTLEHMSEQLKLAGMYLKMEQRVLVSTTKFSDVAPPEFVPASAISFREEGVFSPKNIWTVAYTGTVGALDAFIKGLDRDDINAKGCVLYNRRQYGIKKSGDRFVLGLGQKATPLQFAAVAGRLDNVVLLLHCNAEDKLAPRLRDIIGADGMELLQGVRKASRGKRVMCRSSEKVDCVQDVNLPPRLTAQEVVTPFTP